MTDALDAALARALDRFDVPAMSPGLSARIAAATAAPAASSTARRDRRGMWRRGRQVVLGSLAVGLLSAGAVASGLLGKVGIEVPVLTAMLAPKPHVLAKVRPTPSKSKSAPRIVAPPLPPVSPPVIDIAPAKLTPRPLLPGERMALRQDRRERLQAFAAEHPVAAARIRERVREQLQRRAIERRQALMGPGVDPALPGARRLDVVDRIALTRAARRDRLVAERMIDRRIQARERRMEQRAAADPALSTPAPELAPRADVLTPPLADSARAPFAERLQQMSPERRAGLRNRFEQRRLLRLERRRGPVAN